MRAAVFKGDGRASIEETKKPAPGPGEVLLQLEGCGVCASNLPVWQGREWFRYPLEAGAPGHEPWGRIVECGESVSGLEPGMRVAGLAYRGYAEFDLARADELVHLPAALDGRAFPGEAVACAMNVFRRSKIAEGTRVAVVGAGFIGGLVIQSAVAAGASVTAFSRRQWSMDLAAEQGAVSVRCLDERQDRENAAFECVVECTGTQEGLDSASALTATGGRLVIAGYHQEGRRTVNLQEWNWKGIDVINAHERDPARFISGMQAALNSIERGELDPWPLLTHRVGLDDIDGAFRMMESRPDGFTKAVLCL